MCRLLACPPQTTKDEAIDILLSMEGRNTDGTGYVFVKDRKFHIRKSIQTVSQLAKTNPNFLDHMPYPGWTIIHMRAATHGGICRDNVHPFVAGNNCVCHNGVWQDHKIVKLALSKSVKFYGDTDSEIAAHLINLVGIKKFATEIRHAGVFLVLKRSGDLFAIKTSGDLAINRRKNKTCLLSSELDFFKYKSVEALTGYYRFDKDGYCAKAYEKPKVFGKNYPYFPRKITNQNHCWAGMGNCLPHIYSENYCGQ